MLSRQHPRGAANPLISHLMSLTSLINASHAGFKAFDADFELLDDLFYRRHPTVEPSQLHLDPTCSMYNKAVSKVFYVPV